MREESRGPYANGFGTGTVVRTRVRFVGVGSQLEEGRMEMEGKREERQSRAGEKGRTEKRRGRTGKWKTEG